MIALFPDELLERNQAYASQRTAQPLPPVEPVPLAVVTCFDPRLDPMLRPALGLGDGDGFLFRTAGAIVSPDSATLRNVALAVLLFEVRHVLVLGHSSCRMASFDANAFADSFRGRGVAREAFGDQDLRSWAGAVANPRQGVLESAAVIASAPFLPSDLVIAGGVLDDTTGKIEMVLRPDEATPVATASPATRDATPVAPPVVPPPPDGSAPPPVPTAVEAIHTAVDFLASQEHMHDQLARLRRGLAAETHPLRQLALVKQFVRDGAADSPELRIAFDKLTGELREQLPHVVSKVLVPLVHRKSP